MSNFIVRFPWNQHMFIKITLMLLSFCEHENQTYKFIIILWALSLWFQKLAAECQSAGHSGLLVPFKCDLTKEEDILTMFSAIKAQHKGVDVCINNAGLAHPEVLLNGKTSSWKNMLDVRAQCCYVSKPCFQSSNRVFWHQICFSTVCRWTFLACLSAHVKHISRWKKETSMMGTS